MENWRQVKEIFISAMRLAPDERPSFVERACRGDRHLRREVESLLTSSEEATSFMESPIFDDFGDFPENGKSSFKTGDEFAHYKIIRQIGAGGMGEVYLARDKKLDRQVAVKILNEKFARHESNLDRLKREAKAASALNHPNILVIYEIGVAQDVHFIASEYIEGKTLREILKEKPPDMNQVLDIAVQIAGALSAAHTAHIVHRDIKPENIMVRPDGYVKVLDFGLAKLVAPENHSFLGMDDETIKQNHTGKGVILGTVQYMSPEQAKGERIDKRSDIFSFGALIYEMLAGRTPFAADSISETFANLINQEPLPLSEFSANLPDELQNIVSKMLCKNKDERYQTTKDLQADLRHLKNWLEFQAESERVSLSGNDEQKGEQQDVVKTQMLNAATDGDGLKTQTASSVEYILTEIKRRKFSAFGAAALLCFAAVGLSVYKFYPSAQQQTAESHFALTQKLNFTRLSLSNKAIEAVLSPDGRFVAYVVDGKKMSIRLLQVATNSDVEIVAPTENAGFRDLRFTPDGNRLYYLDQGVNEGTIYQVPTLGGASLKIAEATVSGAGVSPDGKTIAFTARDEKENFGLLQVADGDGSNLRTLFHAAEPYFLLPSVVPAWSADGKSIASLIGSDMGQNSTTRLTAVSVADGSTRELSAVDWDSISGMTWLADGNLIVSGKENSAERGAPPQLWRIASNADTQRITNDVNTYSVVSATINGDTLLAIQAKTLSKLWLVTDNDTAAAVEIPASSGIEGGIGWTPTGKFIFSSEVSGNKEIWTMKPDGSDRRQLTAKQGANTYPSMTADGRYIVFWSDRNGAGGEQIFRMDAEGRNQTQLTKGDRAWSPRLSTDGKWIYYVDAILGDNIFKMPVEGGEPTVVGKYYSPFFMFNIDVSPRGDRFAYEFRGSVPSKVARKIIIVSFNGAPQKTLTLPLTALEGAFHWTPEGGSIAFVDSRNDSANIWTISVDGKSEAKPLTNFKTESIFDFAWSADGKQLAAIRGTHLTDAVLINEAK